MTRMSRTFLAALLPLAILSTPLASATPAPAKSRPSVTDIDPQALDDARAIIATIIPPDKQAETFGSVVATIMAQMRANASRQALDPGLKQVIDRFLDTLPDRLAPVTQRHAPQIVEAMAHAYTREFSGEELKELRAFAATPVGRHYLSRSAALIADPDVAAANAAYSRDAMELAAAMRPELIAAVNGYLAEHPEAAARPVKPTQPAPSVDGR